VAERPREREFTEISKFGYLLNLSNGKDCVGYSRLPGVHVASKSAAAQSLRGTLILEGRPVDGELSEVPTLDELSIVANDPLSRETGLRLSQMVGEYETGAGWNRKR
jgi:hypothetical protein